MRESIGLIAFLVGLAATGAALSAPFFRKERLSPAVFLSISFGAGAGGFALVSFWLDLMGARLGLATVAGILIPGSCAGIYLTLRMSACSIELPQLSKIEAAILCVIGATLVMTMYRAVSVPMRNYDDRAKWSMKAKIIYSGGIIRDEALRDPARLHIDRRYPLIVPYIEAGVHAAMGRFDDRLVKAIFPLFLSALLGVIYFGARDCRSSTAAFVCVLAFSAMPFLSESGLEPGGGAETGYADLPLAFYYTASLVMLLRWKSGWKMPLASAMFIAFAMFTKNEGAVFFATWAICAGATAFRRQIRTNKFIVTTVAIILAPVAINAPFFAFARSLPPDNIDYEAALSLSAFIDNIDRLPLIAVYLASTIVGSSFGFAGLLLLVSVLLFGKHFKKPEAIVLGMAIAIPLVVYSIMLTVTPAGIDWQLVVAAPRLVLHVAPSICLLIAAVALDELS